MVRVGDLSALGVPLRVAGVSGVADGHEFEPDAVGAGEAEALVDGGATLVDAVAGDGAGGEAGDGVALRTAAAAGGFGGGIQGFVPFPGVPGLIEGAVVTRGRRVGAYIGGAVAVTGGDVVEVGRERTAGGQFLDHLGRVVGLRRILPVTAGAILGGVVVGRLVPLVVAGQEVVGIRIAPADDVVAGEGVGAGFGVAVRGSAVAEPVGHAHGVDGGNEQDRAVVAAGEDGVGVAAVFAFPEDFAAAGDHQVVGVGLGFGVEEGGVLGVGDLEFSDLELVVHLAPGRVPLGVLRIARVSDQHVLVAFGLRGGEVGLAVGGDEIAAAGGDVANASNGERVAGARGLGRRGQAHGSRGEHEHFGDGEPAGQPVIRRGARGGFGDGLREDHGDVGVGESADHTAEGGGHGILLHGDDGFGAGHHGAGGEDVAAIAGAVVGHAERRGLEGREVRPGNVHAVALPLVLKDVGGCAGGAGDGGGDGSEQRASVLGHGDGGGEVLGDGDGDVFVGGDGLDLGEREIAVAGGQRGLGFEADEAAGDAGRQVVGDAERRPAGIGDSPDFLARRVENDEREVVVAHGARIEQGRAFRGVELAEPDLEPADGAGGTQVDLPPTGIFGSAVEGHGAAGERLVEVAVIGMFGVAPRTGAGLRGDAALGPVDFEEGGRAAQGCGGQGVAGPVLHAADGDRVGNVLRETGETQGHLLERVAIGRIILKAAEHRPGHGHSGTEVVIGRGLGGDGIHDFAELHRRLQRRAAPEREGVDDRPRGVGSHLEPGRRRGDGQAGRQETRGVHGVVVGQGLEGGRGVGRARGAGDVDAVLLPLDRKTVLRCARQFGRHRTEGRQTPLGDGDVGRLFRDLDGDVLVRGDDLQFGEGEDAVAGGERVLGFETHD